MGVIHCTGLTLAISQLPAPLVKRKKKEEKNESSKTKKKVKRQDRTNLAVSQR